MLLFSPKLVLDVAAVVISSRHSISSRRVRAYTIRIVDSRIGVGVLLSGFIQLLHRIPGAESRLYVEVVLALIVGLIYRHLPLVMGVLRFLYLMLVVELLFPAVTLLLAVHLPTVESPMMMADLLFISMHRVPVSVEWLASVGLTARIVVRSRHADVMIQI